MAGSKNPRFKCNGCSNKLTRNQLKAHSGICLYCKTPIHHDSWRTSSVSIPRALGLNSNDLSIIGVLCQELGIVPVDLYRAAILSRLNIWSSDPEGGRKTLKQDLMLAKLLKV